MWTIPNGTCLRSFFLKVFFLPFFSGDAAPPAASGFAIVILSLAVGLRSLAKDQRRRPRTIFYVFAVDCRLIATVPLRGPLRVRELVWVRCPRTGRLRR